jgi:CRP/FNR family transcriptional regulator
LEREKTVHKYERGQVIFYEGNTPLGIYCIHSGRVKLFKTNRLGKQLVTRILGPGDTMAYRALLSKEPCSSTAEAVEPSTICVISKETLFYLLKESGDLALRFLEKLGHDLGVTEDQMMQLALETIQQRTARLLLLLQEGCSKKSEKDTEIKIPFLRREMAEMIGASIESLIRTLGQFTKRGLIKVEGKEIHFSNLISLRRLAYGSDSETDLNQ